METMLSFDWKSVSVNSAEVIALMRKHRNEKLDVLFHYADGLYRVGVNPENARDLSVHVCVLQFCLHRRRLSAA